MDYPKCIVSNKKEESNIVQRVKNVKNSIDFLAVLNAIRINKHGLRSYIIN